MTKERIEVIETLFDKYYKSEDSFEQTELAIEIIQKHLSWLMTEAKKIKRVEERSDQVVHENNLLYGRLNSIVALAKEKII